MASQFIAELRKIPPVTRFLCASSLAVTLPVILNILPAFYVVFLKHRVLKRLELWRLYTSFFLGSPGIGYIFDIVMLYRNSDQLETTRYGQKSPDYAWQLLVAASAILALNIPLSSSVHSRAFSLALTYLHASLSPPGTQSSFFGLFTFPIIYLPYIMLGVDLLNWGPGAVTTGITGLVVGHLWWWGVWGGATGGDGYAGVLGSFGTAPWWMKRLVGVGAPVGRGLEGVHVIPPRTRLGAAAGTNTASTSGTGYRWGSGQRLGNR